MVDSDTNQLDAMPTVRLSDDAAGSTAASGSSPQAVGSALDAGASGTPNANTKPKSSKASASRASQTPASISSDLTSTNSTNSANLSASGSLSEEDAVKSRRLAHGLSPESTSKAEAAELRRKEMQASAEDRKRKFRRAHRAKVIRRSIIAVVLIVVVGAVFGFWMLRWGLHDDASSFQGTWRVQGTDTTISITDEEIILTDEVAYDYVIDPSAKTLAFTFGGLSGNGRYRFSLDYSQLAIDDGEFDWLSTLMADIPWMAEAVSCMLLGETAKSPALGAGDMVLERIG